MERPIEQNIITNERGTILLVVLIMLVLLSTLGAMSFLNSTTELNTSGDFRKENATFYEADKAMEYAITDGEIYSQIDMTDTVPAFPASDAALNSTVNSGLGPNTMEVVLVDGSFMAKGQGMHIRVEHLKTGPLPPGTGDEDIFQGAYFYARTAVDNDNNGESERTIEGQFARKVPK